MLSFRKQKRDANDLAPLEAITRERQTLAAMQRRQPAEPFVPSVGELPRTLPPAPAPRTQNRLRHRPIDLQAIHVERSIETTTSADSASPDHLDPPYNPSPTFPSLSSSHDLDLSAETSSPLATAAPSEPERTDEPSLRLPPRHRPSRSLPDPPAPIQPKHRHRQSFPHVAPSTFTALPTTRHPSRFFINGTQSIGQGSYGSVFLGYDALEGKEVALKLAAANLEDDETMSVYDALVREAFVLSDLRAEDHIIEMIEFLPFESNGINTQGVLILEYCEGGSLRSKLSSRIPLSRIEIFQILKAFASGLKSIRKHNSFHRDLKPSNLLFRNQNDLSSLRIADFGTGRTNDRTLFSTLAGSRLYMAPELHRGDRYSDKTDLWSIGVILAEMIQGKVPFRAVRNEKELKEEIVNGAEIIVRKIGSDRNHEDWVRLCDIANRLLVRNVRERMGWEEFFDVVDQLNESNEDEDEWW